ncbi:hypothetical protein BDV96DRAFT_571272 [Lophiotrema nucula]|uniref:Ketopantoate reductase PanE/ApbA C terminal-domain-containing protein n=1 Tax=Lophiotrema nucula TaxID=690887 RepID=A0A6A5ZGX9_9PLEO|nr:hypothetical protein BDV96DRAFT_571272 [Lophiotrema nucula]
MSKPQVLIVGCGAVGLSVGYFLSSGASITYLVRPGRKSAFQAPRNLYSYKENVLHTFDNYRVIEDPSEASGETFAFVFDTLDGHTAQSENGTKTLQKVGFLINEKQNRDSFVVYDAIDLDIEKHYATTLAISPDRLLFAGSMLAHQPTPLISTPAAADKTLMNKADMLYSYQPGNIGLVIFNTRPKLVKRLKEVYEQNGLLKITTLPAFAQPLTIVALLHMVTWHIDGWHEFDHLRQNQELWPLMLKAQKEILTLPRLGWTGWLLSLLFGSWMTTRLNVGVADGAIPLVMHEFNKFHHGGKVFKQDIGLLEGLLADGEKTGHMMPALRRVMEQGKKAEEVN